jgi:hypothetical protein
MKLFDEEKELMAIRDLIENNETWAEIRFKRKKNDDGHIKITGIDRHGSEYSMELFVS